MLEMVLHQIKFNRSVRSSPMRMAIAVFGFVLLLPILLLLLLAGCVAFVAFAILSCIAWVGGVIRRLSGRDTAGRKNVRILYKNPENKDQSS